jgi:hypothetical protein
MQNMGARLASFASRGNPVKDLIFWIAAPARATLAGAMTVKTKALKQLLTLI